MRPLRKENKKNKEEEELHQTKDPPLMKTQSLQLLSFFLYLSSFHFPSLEAFTPIDNYLINCGSNGNTTDEYSRNYVGDETNSGSSFLTSTNKILLKNPNPSQISSPLYHTARVFTIDSSYYEFDIKQKGTHMVRLHFFPFTSENYDLKNGLFNVFVDGFSVLSNFSMRNEGNSLVLKEYIVKLNNEKAQILFTPLGKSDFGFVNAIEVFSVPDDLVNGGAKYVSSSGVTKFSGLSSIPLETVHRINVGGPKITPFNDTLWRTWIPDENFLELKNAAKGVSVEGPPNYPPGGATRETAPDKVYTTAQEMNTTNTIGQVNFNLTWKLPVNLAPSGVVKYFVRMHFCDIVSNGQLSFDVYLNNYSALENLNLFSLTYNRRAVPYYFDFVVDSVNSSSIWVSVGKSDLSTPGTENAILNGLEVMKMIDVSEEGNGKKVNDSQNGTKKKKIYVLVGCVIGGFVFLVLVILAVLLVLRCRKKEPKLEPAKTGAWSQVPAQEGNSSNKVSEGTNARSLHKNENRGLKFPFSEIQFVTNNFDKNLIIGSGGFGMVYKGVLRDNTKVAVKRGVPGCGQGLPEFHTELTILSEIRHRHLVSLVGYCEENSEMILVYEFMEKGPLKKHLYGSGLPTLTWKQRLDICISSARGLHYLHTGSAQGIIHRDVKSTNILLDEKYVAKVADFGLSRSGPMLDESHVSTAVKGSFGYLDPEYYRFHKLTDKSDVYSFGVVLYEVLCARPAVDQSASRDQMNLAEWALMWQKKGQLEQIIDPKLMGKINSKSLQKYGETAEKCLAEYGIDRPTMGDVLWNLEYALQLEERGVEREPHEDSIKDVNDLPLLAPLPRIPSKKNRDNEDKRSDISTSEVFSQLITNEGR